MYLVCAGREQSKLEQLEQLELLLLLIFSVYHLLKPDSRFSQIYFLYLLFGRAHILRTLFNIQAGEGSYLYDA